MALRRWHVVHYFGLLSDRSHVYQLKQFFYKIGVQIELFAQFSAALAQFAPAVHLQNGHVVVALVLAQLLYQRHARTQNFE